MNKYILLPRITLNPASCQTSFAYNYSLVIAVFTIFTPYHSLFELFFSILQFHGVHEDLP